ncbi:MAG: DnaJ protein [Acidobacteriota bacterium]|nr:DnaJ protein [Acidobacteriota bacterium]
MEFKDYYKVLGVARDASQEEIQKAYRKLARKYHPDVSKEKGAEARFKEVSEANEVLKDAEKRAKYDQFGAAWKQREQTGGTSPGAGGFAGFPGAEDFEGFAGRGPGFGGSASGFSDFFEMLFGQAARASAGGAPGSGAGGRTGWATWENEGRGGWARPGANQEVVFPLTLEEALAGGVRELALSNGAGGEPRRIKVNLPRGMRSGQTIRVAGKGEEGRAGGAPGDLFLKVEILPHPRFRLEGRDLLTSLEVTPWEAVLGGEAEIRTLDGKVRVRVPAGTSSGRRIRVKGRGFPAGSGGSGASEPGDLYAEVRIVVPESPSEREKELFSELRSASSFHPRGEGV